MYQLKTLPSGLRILTVPAEHTNVFTLLVLVSTGSKYETKRINGISHFLEHMFFKGTRQRPETGEVSRVLDSVGAQYNAFTSKEVTGYWVKASRAHFNLALDIVSDILTEPLLSLDEINKERGVILQELRMRNDDPISCAGILFEELLWGDQPAGWRIIGSEKTIKSFRRADFLSYFSDRYVAKNTLVVLGGAFPKDASTRIRSAFSPLSPRGRGQKRTTNDRQSRPRVLVSKKETEASNIVLGVRGFSLYDERRFALELLGTILGGNSSSRLFMEVRERLGLAYYIRAGSTLYMDSGYFEVSAGVPHEKVPQAIEVIIRELRRAKEDGVTPEELQKAKDYIRGHTQIELEDSSALAMFFGDQVLFKKRVATPAEYLKKIDSVSAREVNVLARSLFSQKHSNLVVVGKPQNENRLYQLLCTI